MTHEDYCEDFIENLKARKTCDWCKHPHEPVMPRVGLCSHCNRIRLQHKQLLKWYDKFRQEQHGGITFEMDFRLRVQTAMIEHAKLEGRRYGQFFAEDFTGTKLEHEWRSISERVAGKDLFYGLTNSLNYSFSMNQRRYLFYLLSLMNRGSMRKNRRGIAMGMVVQDTIDRPAKNAHPFAAPAASADSP